MSALHALLDTSLYKNIEVSIHPQWNNMFALSQQIQSANVAKNVDDAYENDNDDNHSCVINNEDRFE